MLCSVRQSLDFSSKVFDVSQASLAQHSGTLDNKHTWKGFGALGNKADQCFSSRSSCKREWNTTQMKENQAAWASLVATETRQAALKQLHSPLPNSRFHRNLKECLFKHDVWKDQDQFRNSETQWEFRVLSFPFLFFFFFSEEMDIFSEELWLEI